MDPFGTALQDRYYKKPGDLVIERLDGVQEAVDVDALLSDDLTLLERDLLNRIQGKVLDIDSAAGKYALALQNHPHTKVSAIEPSLLCLRIAKMRGVKDIKKGSIGHFPFARPYFDGVCLLGDRFGEAGGANEVIAFLKKVKAACTRDGTIIATCVNPYVGASEADKAYLDLVQAEGFSPGALVGTYSYKGQRGERFQRWRGRPEDAKKLAKAGGWYTSKVYAEEERVWGIVLKRA